MNADVVGAPVAVAKANPFSGVVQILKWVFSFPSMLVTFFLGCLLYRLREFRVDPDLWWHIKLGQDIARTHHWPTTDPYSFTVHGTPWMAYEWLGDVAIGLIARFGLQALEAMLMGMTALITIAIYCYASLSAKNAKSGFVAAMLVTMFAVANFNLRPQMFGALFLAITLIVLELFRQGRPRALGALPPLFLLWINTHGSWIVGLGVVVVTLMSGLFEFQMGGVLSSRWTQKQRIQLELALLGSLAALGVTPYGTRLATYPFMVASSLPLNLQFVEEWFPMPLNESWGKFFLALLVGAVVLQTIYQYKFRLQQWVLAFGGVAMACMHVRFVLMFAPFFAPILAVMLSRWFDEYRPAKDKFALNAVLMAGVVIAIAWYFPSGADLQRYVGKQFPVRAISFLRNRQVQEPIFNSYNFGGYLVAELPEHKVFIDGRGDLYEIEGVMWDYLQAAKLKPAAFSIFRLYGIKTCILERGEPLEIVLEEQPGWKPVYEDDMAVILERSDSVDAAVAASVPRPLIERRQNESPAD